jgi:hypothetical protein
MLGPRKGTGRVDRLKKRIRPMPTKLSLAIMARLHPEWRA